MSIHVSPLDRECRAIGEPWRVYIGVKGWNLTIALRPSGPIGEIAGVVPVVRCHEEVAVGYRAPSSCSLLPVDGQPEIVLQSSRRSSRRAQDSRLE